MSLFSCFGNSCLKPEDEDDVFLRNNPEIAKKYAKRMAANKVREEKEVNKIIQSVQKEVAEEKKNNDEDAKFQARLFNLNAPSPPKGGNKSIKKSIKRKKTRRNKSIKRKNIRRNKSIKRKKTRSKTRSIKY